MSKNVLVIGGGGREHAISWKIAQSPLVKTVYAAPGSHAIQEVPKTKIVPEVRVNNHQEIANFCKQNDVELVIVGPEDPLASGIADSLQKEGIAVFGPGKDGARIESDKDWAKAFMDKHGIPTAKWKGFKKAEDAKNFVNSADFPALVVKASGLAAGKGVVVAADKKEACDAIDEIKSKFGAASETIVIEELLQGEEVSVLAFCDGQTVKAMLPAQDHKRIFDNDQGPNTGGMGAYCPCPLLNAKDLAYVQKNVLERAVAGFQKDGIKFVGVLYAGLMLTPSGPKVLEFNCRFGDPETEVILPLLDSDLYSVMAACCHGVLDQIDLKWKDDLTAVGVVMASRGYPETSSKGQVITGIDEVNDRPNHVVFHCGTALKDNRLVTNGGRVLIAVSLAPQLAVAAAQATQAAGKIQFDGRQYRKDISHKGIARAILRSGKLTYKQSGVDITAGNDLVDHIKPAAKSTNRAGSVGGLGGFGGVFDLKAAGFKDALLVMGTDGVGTKLKIAHEMGIHNTIGIDLVAMCVNDVLAHGAEPLSFLDYYACGHLDVKVAKEVVSGVAEGCRQAMCSLSGGETAEMPGMYPPGEYDVAGFTVGAVERDQILPRTNDIKEGDVVIGLGSSGVHSNGFSLVRKIMKVAGVNYKDPAPFSKTGKTFGEELLEPTKIYVKSVIPAVRSGKVKAFAHITGGGLTENVPRVLPNHLGVELNAEKWSIPDVFPWMAAAGNVNQAELLRTFNCGIGGILIIDPKDEQTVVKATGGMTIGNVIKKRDEQVIVNNFDTVMEIAMRPHVPTLVSQIKPKKRVGVLISGSGTNLQALIDATQGSDMGAEIVLVISNKDQVEGLRRAQRAGIPTKFINHKDFPSRSDFDTALHNELISAGVELICLAGFMRILTGEFTAKWKGKLINVHPALLPAYKGTHAQRQALEAGAIVSGCTVHFVEEAVDCGHYIAMEAVPVLANDTEDTLTERIKQAEHRAFPRALELVARGKVRIGDDNKLVWT